MAWPRRRIGFDAAVVFLGAWAARMACLAVCARFSAAFWKDMALMYDGHVYVLIARSAPSLYTGIETYFPAYKNSEYFTGWFPVYPILIAAVNGMVSDMRLSALLACQLSASAAVAVFYLLARRMTQRPVLAAALFCFFPATWLVVGSFAFAEAAYVLFFLLTVLCAVEKRWFAAAVLAGVAAVTQKTGVLAIALLAWEIGRQEGRRAVKRWPLLLAALAPLGLLLAYWGAVFGEPLIGLRIQREIFRAPLFAWPFESLTNGLFSPTQIFSGHFWARKALIAGSCAFYAAVLLHGWRKNDPARRLLVAWLGSVLLFHLCVGGLWGYYSFSRFMTAAAPAAILLIVDRLPRWTPAAAAALALACFWTAAIEAQDAVALMYARWPKGYFESLAAHVP